MKKLKSISLIWCSVLALTYSLHTAHGGQGDKSEGDAARGLNEILTDLNSPSEALKQDALIELATVNANLNTPEVIKGLKNVLEKSKDRFSLEEAIDAIRRRAAIVSPLEAEDLWSTVDDVSQQISLKKTARDPASDMATAAMSALEVFGQREDADKHPFSKLTVSRIATQLVPRIESSRRELVARLLAHTDQEDKLALKVLSKLLNEDPDYRVREQAAIALFSHDSVEAKQILAKKITSHRSETWTVNEAVINSLVGYRKEEEAGGTFAKPEVVLQPEVQTALFDLIKLHNDGLMIIPLLGSWANHLQHEEAASSENKRTALLAVKSILKFLQAHSQDDSLDASSRLSIINNIDAIRKDLDLKSDAVASDTRALSTMQ